MGNKHMKYLTLTILSFILTACNSGGSGVISSDASLSVNIDIAGVLDLPIEEASVVTINSASHSGAGCPSGTGEVILSPDKKTLSILFDEYQAEAGFGTGPDEDGPGLTTSRVACNLAISLHIPLGYQAFLIGADFRGAVSLPVGAIAEFNREYFFAAESSPVLTATWSGEVENDSIEIFDDLYADSYSHSRCGEDVILRSNTSLYISAPADADTALIQMDSFDYQNEQSKPRFDYQLSYEQCS